MSHVNEFGAIGDGRTDDTDAIRHALRDGDGMLQFGRGTYLISSTIEVRLNDLPRAAIDGMNGLAKIVMSGPGPAFRLTGTHNGSADPKGFGQEVWARQRMPQISGIEIEGSHPDADGIQLMRTMQCVISGVALRGLRNGIHLFERNRNVLISDCQIFHNSGVGVYLDRVNLHQINITGNHISYNRLGGIRIEGSEIRNLQITGNDIEYNNYRARDAQPDVPTAEIFIDSRGETTSSPRPSVREFTISSNTIQSTYSPGGANIRVIGPDATGNLPPGMAAITGNVIGNQEINIHLVGCRGIAIGSNFIYAGYQHNVLIEQSEDLTISGNNFGHNYWAADRMVDNNIRLVACSDVIIGATEIRGAPGGKTTDSAGPGRQHLGLVELEDCQRINLNGCILRDPSQAGIYARRCSWVNVTGCQILDTRGDGPKMRVAVDWSGTGSHNQVSSSQMGPGTMGVKQVLDEANVNFS
jgi:hypothetical protein